MAVGTMESVQGGGRASAHLYHAPRPPATPSTTTACLLTLPMRLPSPPPPHHHSTHFPT